MDCDHSEDELIGELCPDANIETGPRCDECEEVATHDLGHTILCCTHYQEDINGPQPYLAPREDFHSDD